MRKHLPTYLALTFLAAALFVVTLASASQAQSADAPYGYYPGTSDAKCPELKDYKWTLKAPGTWDNAHNYNNHSHGSFGCRTRAADNPTPTPYVTPRPKYWDPPYGYYPDTRDALCPQLKDYKWTPKAAGTWDNAHNYNNHSHGSFGCRTRDN